MNKVTLTNYRKDKYYPRVARAVSALLASGDEVTPIDVFRAMGLLSDADLEAWRRGLVRVGPEPAMWPNAIILSHHPMP